MTDNKPMMLYSATYDSVSAAMTDLEATGPFRSSGWCRVFRP